MALPALQALDHPVHHLSAVVKDRQGQVDIVVCGGFHAPMFSCFGGLRQSLPIAFECRKFMKLMSYFLLQN